MKCKNLIYLTRCLLSCFNKTNNVRDPNSSSFWYGLAADVNDTVLWYCEQIADRNEFDSLLKWIAINILCGC